MDEDEGGGADVGEEAGEEEGAGEGVGHEGLVAEEGGEDCGGLAWGVFKAARGTGERFFEVESRRRGAEWQGDGGEEPESDMRQPPWVTKKSRRGAAGDDGGGAPMTSMRRRRRRRPSRPSKRSRMTAREMTISAQPPRAWRKRRIMSAATERAWAQPTEARAKTARPKSMGRLRPRRSERVP